MTAGFPELAGLARLPPGVVLDGELVVLTKGVPDLGAVLQYVARHNMDLDDQLYVSAVGPILVRDVIYGYHVEIERSGQDFYAHKTGFTAKSLIRVMQEGGFPFSGIFARSTFELSGYFFKQQPGEEIRKMLNIVSPV